jgi:hypothetical protein
VRKNQHRSGTDNAALEAQQETVVDLARIVDAVEIDDEGLASAHRSIR